MVAPSTVLESLLSHEYVCFQEANESRPVQNLRKARRRLLAHVREVVQGGDLEQIVATEKFIVEGDLSRYANSKAMISSLKNALVEIAAIERHIDIVKNPASYRAVDHVHRLPRNRKADLPFDEARQALASHRARLANMDKSRLTDEEKELVDARRDAVQSAEKQYIELQEQALAATPE